VLIAAWLVPAQGLFAVLSRQTGQWAPVVLVALLIIIARRALAPRGSTPQSAAIDAGA